MKIKCITSGVNAVKKIAGKAFLVAKAHAPEALLIGGTAVVVAGIVYACKATTKLDYILDESLERETEIKDEHLDEKEETKELAKSKIKTGIDIVKVYAKPAGMVIGGFGMIYTGFGIQKRWLSGAIATAASVSDKFDQYRERVKNLVGEEQEDKLYAGSETRKIEYVDEETGKKKKKDIEVLPDDFAGYSKWSKLFDEASKYWIKHPGYNLNFLDVEEKYFNDIINGRGYLLMSEIADTLDVEITGSDYRAGFIKDDPKYGVCSFNLDKHMAFEQVRLFKEGKEPSVWLDLRPCPDAVAVLVAQGKLRE